MQLACTPTVFDITSASIVRTYGGNPWNEVFSECFNWQGHKEEEKGADPGVDELIDWIKVWPLEVGLPNVCKVAERPGQGEHERNARQSVALRHHGVHRRVFARLGIRKVDVEDETQQNG